jgi:uncharacterized membrane protein (UPF0127 family)
VTRPARDRDVQRRPVVDSRQGFASKSRRGFASERRPARLRLVAAISALVAVAASCEPEAPLPDAWVEIGTARVAVELAETPEEQARGLGYRDRLEWDHGMYFPYRRPGFYGFWMRGMRFSIDIVWIRDGRIVDLHRDVPFEPGGNGPTLRPRELVDAVLEVPAGYSAAKGWSIGDRVRLERVSP